MSGRSVASRTQLEPPSDHLQNVLEDDVTAAQGAKPKTQAAIKAAKKKAKRAAGDDSESEEDYKPSKAAGKPKALGKPRPYSTKASPSKRDRSVVWTLCVDPELTWT